MKIFNFKLNKEPYGESAMRQIKLISNFKLEPLDCTRCNSAELNQISNYRRGFTLIELIVAITIIAVLSAIILFSTTLYINKGRDSNIASNLVVLIPAGEVFYGSNGNNYNNTSTLTSFCDPSKSPAYKNSLSQMPDNPSGKCYVQTTNPKGVCCNATSQAWAACATEFSGNGTNAYCVDSRGAREEIPNSACANSITQCPQI